MTAIQHVDNSTWAPDVVIYHDPCMDGFTAAWACWKRWPAADYVGANYGRPAPDVAGKNVLIVDFSYKRADLDALAHTAASIVILDHHKSAAADLEPFAFAESGPGAISPEDVPGMLCDLAELGRPPVIAIFDMERSGARMAWDFAHGPDSCPALAVLIEDRDLWRFTYSDVTRDFHLRLSIEPKTWEAWDEAAESTAAAPDLSMIPLAHEGRVMRLYRDWLVERIAGQAEIGMIGKDRVPVVDCPYELASEVGDKLCRMFPDRPFAAMRVHDHDGTSFSLRSRGGFDVSEVAVRYGGGGHAGAAGFRVPPSI